MSDIIEKLQLINVTEESFETLKDLGAFLKSIPDLHEITQDDITKLHLVGECVIVMVPNMKACFDLLGTKSITPSPSSL